MRCFLGLVLVALGGLFAPASRADAPALLSQAIQRCNFGQGDLAFTQETRAFLSDGGVKEERRERYDPSLPDGQRWRLLEVNGLPATDEQRRQWEVRKNSRPRRKVDESPSKYLDLANATLVGENARNARFRVPVRPEVQRLLSLENIDVVITVDKQTGNIAGIGAVLRQPIRVLMGVARITDLDVDLRINPVEGVSADPTDNVEPGSTARVKISRLGRPVEYDWSDFRRVPAFSGT
jgi:hypothetical protein